MQWIGKSARATAANASKTSRAGAHAPSLAMLRMDWRSVARGHDHCLDPQKRLRFISRPAVSFPAQISVKHTSLHTYIAHPMPDKQREQAANKRKATALARAPQREEDRKFIYGETVRLLAPTMGQQEVLARFTQALLDSPGNSMNAQFLVDRMRAAKIESSLSTNEYHRRLMRTDPDHYVRDSRRGRPRAVDDDQLMLLVGYVVHCSRIGEECHYDDLQIFHALRKPGKVRGKVRTLSIVAAV